MGVNHLPRNRKRKTFEVKEFLDHANRMLAMGITQGQKSGICTMVEQILMDTGNYHGYNNNYWLKQGCEEWKTAGRPDFPVKLKFINGPDELEGRGDFNRHYYR